MELPEHVANALALVTEPFEVLECDPEFADTAAFCERYGYPLESSANTIVVSSTRGTPISAACLVTADRKLDLNQRVRRHLGVAKMSFAGQEETVSLTGMELGGVTVFGLPTDLPVLVDAHILGLEWIILGAGTRHAKIKASPAILTELPSVQVVSGLSKSG